jgi:hypothetical protein
MRLKSVRILPVETPHDDVLGSTKALADRAEAMAERVRDLYALMDTLTTDVVELVTGPRRNEAAFRRAFVRSVFALIEGGLSACSAYILEGPGAGGDWVLQDEDRVVLWDSVADPSGERPAGGRPKLIQRTKEVFKTGGKIFGQPPTADFSGRAFQAFQRAVTVRDRLMHPKRSSDLVVSDYEIRDLEAARDWFRGAAKEFFTLAFGELKVRIEKYK